MKILNFLSTMRFCICGLLFAILCLYGCSTKETKKNDEAYPTVCGSFVQDWLVRNWSDDRWDQEFKDLKEAGMEYLIFSPALHTDNNGNVRALYPSSLTDNSNDLYEICLRNAQKNGFKIYISLNFHERWWQFDYLPEWLYEQMDIGNHVADELIKQYKDRYGETMYGWYWVWEVDNLNWNRYGSRETLARAMNINRDHLASVTPDMPFMLSPFVNYRVGNSEVNRQLWEEVINRVNFREGDIFAPQDCVGAGGLTIEMLPEWFNKLKSVVDAKPGLLFWSNVEIFDQRFWTSATADRFVKQMEQVQPYVSNMITFAYSHYYSPLNVNRKFHEAYLHYCRHGVLPEVIVPPLVTNVIVETQNDGQNVLKWDAPHNTTNLLGYRIYKDGIQTGEILCGNDDNCKNTFTDKDGSRSSVYTVSAFNVIGDESLKTKALMP